MNVLRERKRKSWTKRDYQIRERRRHMKINTEHKFYIAFKIQKKIKGMKYDVKKRAFILKQAFSL